MAGAGQDFRDNRLATAADVRKGIVRMSFGWKNNSVVIISGLIISRNEGTYEILANGTFFIKEKKQFVVRFPLPPSANALYGEEVQVDPQNVKETFQFIRFYLTPNESEAATINQYIQPITFELGNIPRQSNVDLFFFPREKHITPTIYSPGSIIDATMVDNTVLGVTFNDCPNDEYAHFGSPLFNQRGHLIGIAYDSQSRLHAWSVSFLSATVLKDIWQAKA